MNSVADLRLSIAFGDYDRTRSLAQGRVVPNGIEPDIHVLRPLETFPRMLRNQEFDVAEMSLAAYVTLVAREASPFVGLPVMLLKVFRHDCIYVRADAGISEPADLRGKRIGVVQYGATAAVYMKGLLQHEYGVAPSEMEWFMGGQNTAASPPMVPLDLPPDIRLQYLSEDQTLEGMILTGELDAIFGMTLPNIFINGSGRLVRLFPDFKEVERDCFQRTGIFPIAHTVVMRKDTYEQHQWTAASLYDAFCEAKDIAIQEMYDTSELRSSLPFTIDHTEEARRLFGHDFWAYGVEPNRPAIEAMCQYIVEQGLAPRVVSPEELFVPTGR